MKKKVLIPIIVILVAVIAVVGWYFGYKQPHDKELARQAEELRNQTLAEYQTAYSEYTNAVQNYNTEAEQFNVKAGEFNAVVEEFSAFLKSIDDSNIFQEDAYDQSTITDLLRVKSEAEATLPQTLENKEPYALDVAKEFVSEDTIEVITTAISEISGRTQSIADATTKLIESGDSITIPDFSDSKNSIQEKWDLASDSVKIQEQITNPSEDFIISRILRIEEITDVQAATEDKDPNGMLGKQGWYTAAILFRSANVDSSYFSDDEELYEIGTDAGGQIEVYATKEDAEKRNEYLAGFDGSALRPGSHTVLGTMVIRTSDYLKASQQKALEAAIIAALLELE